MAATNEKKMLTDLERLLEAGYFDDTEAGLLDPLVDWRGKAFTVEILKTIGALTCGWAEYAELRDAICWWIRTAAFTIMFQALVLILGCLAPLLWSKESLPERVPTPAWVTSTIRIWGDIALSIVICGIVSLTILLVRGFWTFQRGWVPKSETAKGRLVVMNVACIAARYVGLVTVMTTAWACLSPLSVWRGFGDAMGQCVVDGNCSKILT